MNFRFKVSTLILKSESVSEGHPDKMADQISDAILDALLEQDKGSRVACETMIKTGMVIVAGEITTEAYVDIENIVRGVVNEIGYNNSESGFDSNTCAVLNGLGNNLAISLWVLTIVQITSRAQAIKG